MIFENNAVDIRYNFPRLFSCTEIKFILPDVVPRERIFTILPVGRTETTQETPVRRPLEHRSPTFWTLLTTKSITLNSTDHLYFYSL